MMAARLTQEERRAATRSALLDATLASLLAHGVAGTSTRGVATMAGVSQGALQHHFPSKSELVGAALTTALVDSLEDLLAPAFAGGQERDRAAELLDRLWRFHHLPVFRAVVELLSLAQRHAPTGEQMAPTLADLMGRIEAAVVRAVPRLAGEPDFTDRVGLVVAAVRGLAALSGIPRAGAELDWPAMRPALVELLVPEPETTPTGAGATGMP